MKEYKLQQNKFGLNHRKKILGVKQWNKLTRNALETLSLQVFKNMMDNHFSGIV